MPPLLRRELERQFRERQLAFMVSTSTLVFGLNLPARNVFMLKPTMGRNSPISPQNFWNLAGRAGRLGHELEGNVYLIDYDEWSEPPISGPKELHVTSALGTAIAERSAELIDFLTDESVASNVNPEFEVVLGKLVIDDRAGKLSRTLGRYRTKQIEEQVAKIERRVADIASTIEIPADVIDRSIGVSIFRQRDLLDYFLKRLDEIQPKELIPDHPLGDFKRVQSGLMRAFKRIHTYLLRYPAKDRRHSYFATFALLWMRGSPLPALIDNKLDYNKRSNIKRSVGTVIRETMEDIDNYLRFMYVKYFTCYNALLELALAERGLGNYVASIPNIPLFLEMGGSSGSMVELIGLGLSRTSAEALSSYLTDKTLSGPALRAWLRAQDLSILDISPICRREIEDLLALVA